MSDKYAGILTDMVTKFSTNGDVDEPTRRIVMEVINAEISKISLKRPHKIIEEIKGIIEREAKQQM